MAFEATRAEAAAKVYEMVGRVLSERGVPVPHELRVVLDQFNARRFSEVPDLGLAKFINMIDEQIALLKKGKNT